MNENFDDIDLLKTININESDNSSFPNKDNQEFQDDEQENNNKDEIKRKGDRSVFSTLISNLSDINPLRDLQNKHKLAQKSTRKKAIIESVVNLKLQYILYKIRDYIRKIEIKSNENFNPKTHTIFRTIRNITLFVYGVLMFFERPWFCYEKSTIPVPEYFNFTKYVEEETAFFGIPFMNNYAFLSIEICLTLILIITQMVKFRNEYHMKHTNLINYKYYRRMQIVLFIFLFICLGDLIAAISTNRFPILNFVLRAFFFVYMIRRTRLNMVSIGKVLWKTKTIFLLLFLTIIVFAFIGHFLFQQSSFFNTFVESILQLYILLSTCNFPDIMLSTFPISKLAIIFFIIYVSFNYFIILSYLRTSYYTKYYQLNKEDCLEIVRNIINKQVNQEIFQSKEFQKFLIKQKHYYCLNDDEYNNILIILNLYNQNEEVLHEVKQMMEQTAEKKTIKNTFYGVYLLKSIWVEIMVNVLCIFFLVIINFYEDVAILVFELVWCIFLLFEPYLLIKSLGLKRTVFHHFNRVTFHIFNFAVIVSILVTFAVSDIPELEELYDFFIALIKLFLGLRTIRIFVFLDKFQMIRNIYKIIRISKEMFYRNLFTLYSLFLLFSTFSMLLTGGTIKKGSFDDVVDDSVPPNYEYVNFNDFPNSFITCFSLLMVNNLNVLVKSLTRYVQLNHVAMEFYFATFYFLSTLIIVNIIQTLLLELYLVTDFNEKTENKGEINSLKEDKTE